MRKTAIAITMLVLFSGAAEAKRHHHPFHHHHGARSEIGRHYSSGSGRPHAWCGWYMRQQVGHDPGSSYNLARNWAHWGHATTPHVGAVVVWPHHVGKIVGGSPGHWVVESGNDGNMVRRRERSMRGVIAWREA